jgi:EAL domain-containing protein (putative c-di-GMP-specific phosphodiesterase class I)
MALHTAEPHVDEQAGMSATGTEAEVALERDVRAALDAGLFRIHWQPIVACASGELLGFEALIRWERAGHGDMPPASFVPVVERLGLFRKLDTWVLRRACEAASRWPVHLRACINVSACWFDGPGLPAAVAQALEESGIDPGRLELEVSEAVVIENKGTAATELARIKTLGVRLSLDDFGTGYASLGYLQEMPFDKLKLDQSFVRRLGEDRRTEAIVRAVLQLGAGLGMTVCAEGVERADQLAILQAYGCDEVQGFLIGYPEHALPDMLDFYDRLDESMMFMLPETPARPG